MDLYIAPGRRDKSYNQAHPAQQKFPCTCQNCSLPMPITIYLRGGALYCGHSTLKIILQLMIVLYIGIREREKYM